MKKNINRPAGPESTKASLEDAVDFAIEENGFTHYSVSVATTAFSSNQPNKTDLVIDRVPYSIRAVPFTFNGQKRFYISINNGNDHVFTWDEAISQMRAIDDDSATLPAVLEEAISKWLGKEG